MEPMTLGSPSGSPATNVNPYLPSFLMGDAQVPSTPRNNTLSPNKSGRNVSYATSPSPTSPKDYNRSTLAQKTLFGGYQQVLPATACINNYPSTTSIQSHNSISGPPTQGLFDSLRDDGSPIETPTRSMQPQSQGHNGSAFGVNQIYQQQQMGGYNDSFLSNSNVSFSASRTMVSPLGAPTALTNPCNAAQNSSYMLQYTAHPRCTEFWVTVYGFPPSATSTILQHFAQCGSIVDKVFPSQNSNWVHLKYSSRVECDKALNYNEKILNNNIMIGVTHCKDKSIVDKENQFEINTQPCMVRSLTSQSDTAFVVSPSAPQKRSGIMDKAMDLIFGW